MTIKVGDKLPDTKFRVMTAEGPAAKDTGEIFKGKKDNYPQSVPIKLT